MKGIPTHEKTETDLAAAGTDDAVVVCGTAVLLKRNGKRGRQSNDKRDNGLGLERHIVYLPFKV